MQTPRLLVAALGVSALLVACTPSPAQVRESAPEQIDNCGFSLTMDAAPERIVTIKSSTTELVLALGAGDRIVGTAFPDGDLPEGLQFPEPAPPELAEKAPGSEAVLAVEPDLIIAGWESNLTAENAGEREDLESWGIASYVAPPACEEPEYRPTPLTFEHIFDYILETGTLIGEEEAAAEIVAAQRETLEGITTPEETLSALWYSSGSDIPFVGGGIGAPQLLMEAAGLRNINENLEETWASVSWEAIADADPEVIVLVDSAWNSVEYKIEKLESNPVTAAMTAVKHGRYLTIDFPASEAGIRSVDAAASLAEQVAEIDW